MWTEEIRKFFTNLTNRPGTAGFGWNVTTTPDTGSSAQIGSVTETAPTTDTASSGLNGRLQRIAQRLTTLIAGVVLKTEVGRTSISLYANNHAVGATTAEQAITVNISSGIVAVTTGVSYTPPAGKTFRILYISFNSTANAVATAASTLFNLRYNAAGAVVVGSTPILLQRTLAHPAVASDFKQTELQLTQGMDIVGDGTASIGITVNSTYAVNGPTVGVSLVGFLFTT